MRCFDPHEFVELLESGAFDSRLNEELQRLSKDQLEQVAEVVLRQRCPMLNGFDNTAAVLEQA
jgi:hypothetical protein